MGVLYTALLVAGCALFLVAFGWTRRTRRVRKLWRSTHHKTSRVAIVLELEDVVHELELSDAASR